MPITVTDDQGVQQEICPAKTYGGLFDPDNMSQEQIDTICNLFTCGPMDVDALATTLYLLCQQNGAGASEPWAWANWVAAISIADSTATQLLMQARRGDPRFHVGAPVNSMVAFEDGFYGFGVGSGVTVPPGQSQETQLYGIKNNDFSQRWFVSLDETVGPEIYEQRYYGEIYLEMVAGDSMSFYFYTNSSGGLQRFPSVDGDQGGFTVWGKLIDAPIYTP